MITTKLITLSDITSVKSISLNVNEVKQLTPHILEAQNFDLRQFLGDELYLDLIADYVSSPSLVLYADLFNGGSYNYGGQTYYNDGLKMFLIYSTYARYTANSNIISTATGFVQKTNEYSDGISEKTISRLITQARSGAESCENSIRYFLQRNSSIYPLYKCNKQNKTTNGFTIRRVGQ